VNNSNHRRVRADRAPVKAGDVVYDTGGYRGTVDRLSRDGRYLWVSLDDSAVGGWNRVARDRFWVDKR
jgi:hypothetical protein